MIKKKGVHQRIDNLEENPKFLQLHKRPKLNHEEIENLNRSTTSKEIEAVIKKKKKFSNKKMSRII